MVTELGTSTGVPGTEAPSGSRPSGRPVNDPVKGLLKRIRVYGTNLFRPRLLDFQRASLTIGFETGPILSALAPARASMGDRIRDEFQQHLTVLESRLGVPHRLSSVPMAMTAEEALFLYSLVRLREPKCVVETGVASGVSTYFILCALRENRVGSLTSFDVSATAGSLLPLEDRQAWRFVVLDPRNVKREFVQKLDHTRPVDLFIHDSDHSYGHQYFEYRSILPLMADHGLLASDDVDASFAYLDFCAANGFRAHYLISATKVFGIAEVRPAPYTPPRRERVS